MSYVEASLVTPIDKDNMKDVGSFTDDLWVAFIDALQERLELESAVSAVDAKLVFMYKDHEFQIDPPKVKFVNGWNSFGYEEHYVIIWQNSDSNSLLSRKLSPTSYKILVSTLKKLFPKYSFLKKDLFEVRCY